MNYQVSDVICKVIDSNDTSTGGGAASALAGAMAAGMISMVAKLSKKKPVNFTVEQYDKIANECDRLADDLKQGSLKDITAYGMILDAFKLQKSTDDEKKTRSYAISTAAEMAAVVPRDNAKFCARVHKLGITLCGNSNPACKSDLVCALYLSEIGVKGCVLNIQANLNMIKDETICAALKDDMLKFLLEAICY